MSESLLSFGALVSVPIAAVAGSFVLRRRVLRRAGPSVAGVAVEALISVGITIGITLAICLGLSWSGFTESQFYRPSRRDWGEVAKLGLEPEEVRFASADGTSLHGWLLRSAGRPRATVVHFHGSDRNVTSSVRHSQWLTEHGYHVLVFDYRGYGRSDGRPTRSGVVEDSEAALRHVLSRDDLGTDAVVLWGQSMGGQLAVVAAERVGARAVRGVVAEATYASYAHHVKDKLAAMGPLWLIQWGVWLTTSDAHAAERVVGRLAPTPLVLVHGTSDRVVRPYHGDRLLAAAGEPRELWRVEGAGHLDVFHRQPWRARLLDALERWTSGASSSGE